MPILDQARYRALNGGLSPKNAGNQDVAVHWEGAIAQLGERVVRNDEVGGSIRLAPPTFARFASYGWQAD